MPDNELSSGAPSAESPTPDRFPGRRVPSPFDQGGGLVAEWPAPGDYYLYPTVGWCGVAPNGAQVGLMKHEVVEHEDGAITVSPSILVTSPSGPSWHGYLERGVWRKC